MIVCEKLKAVPRGKPEGGKGRGNHLKAEVRGKRHPDARGYKAREERQGKKGGQRGREAWYDHGMRGVGRGADEAGGMGFCMITATDRRADGSFLALSLAFAIPWSLSPCLPLSLYD